MGEQKTLPTRAQLIGGILATGTLAACGGGGVSTTLVPSTAATFGPNCSSAATPAGVNEILSDPVFAAIDKAALAAVFDPTSQIEALYQGYFSQTGQLVQSINVIRSIPSAGIVIRSPGTYVFGGNLTWTPSDVQSAAITIQCSNVTLDMAGYSLTASVADKSQQTTGILVLGPAANPTLTNVTITNGSVANATEYGVFATAVCGLTISRVAVSGICMQNLAVRYLTPAGIQVSGSIGFAITDCSVSQVAVTTDSSAGIFVISSVQGTVSGCTVSGMVNDDGAVQGFGYIKCIDVTTTNCTATSLQSHFNGNVLATGHTVLGFCPILCQSLSYAGCSASGLTGCCDDCHGMSVFLDSQITVSGFTATNIVDGVAASNSGAKATGLEVYGVDVTITNSSASYIKAINPQDKQAAGFSAWGLSIQFERCTAAYVSVQDDLGAGAFGTGFGWAPDPRPYFRGFGAVFTTYTDCTADHCDVGFDTWNHVDSTWTSPVITNCTTGFLVQAGGTRLVSGNACSECNPPISATLTNFESGNTLPPSAAQAGARSLPTSSR